MLCWNKSLWLDGVSHMTRFDQSECFISTYALLKFVNDLGPALKQSSIVVQTLVS